MVKRTIEERKNLSESDVLEKLKTLGPMLQQEYLENLNNRIELEPNLKVLVSKKLAEVYANRGMWSSAARVLTNAALACERFEPKKELHMQAGAVAIKAGDYLLADDNFRGAVEAAAPNEKARVQSDSADLYMAEATALDKSGKMTKAAQVYERILKSAKDNAVKRKITERLMALYEKLGRISDSMRMKSSLANL